jgi:hypothetical protein
MPVLRFWIPHSAGGRTVRITGILTYIAIHGQDARVTFLDPAFRRWSDRQVRDDM